jgi:fructose/tagatose bisphosphate aldolase
LSIKVYTRRTNGIEWNEHKSFHRCSLNPFSLKEFAQHGAPRASPWKRFDAKLPGAKGIPDDAIQKAVSLGIAKINIDTDLRLSFIGAIREVLANKPEEFDPRKILGPGREAIKQTVQLKMRRFGSSGKAP